MARNPLLIRTWRSRAKTNSLKWAGSLCRLPKLSPERVTHSFGVFVVALSIAPDSAKGADSPPTILQHAISTSKAIPVIGSVIALALFGIFGWIIKDPLQASKQIWRFASYVFGYFNRQYTKAAVENDANHFLAKQLFPGASDAPVPALKVDFVSSADDARLHRDGHIVVRMRRERDQSRNTLLAVRTALTHLFYPHARPYLAKQLTTAIDLEVLQLLANLLGNTAQAAYSTEILGPRTSETPETQSFLSIMHEVEQKGLFGHVLLQEFAYLSDRLRTRHPPADLADEAQRFVSWLHGIATRPQYDESSDLIFIGKEIKIAFILAAKMTTASKGTLPYERRLGIDLLQGAESIYLLGLTPAHTPLCEQIARRLDSDQRVKLVRSATVPVVQNHGVVSVRLVHFRRNSLYMPTAPFAEQLAANGVSPGSVLMAEVRAVEDRRAHLRIMSLDAWLEAGECAWGYRGSVSRFVKVGDRIPVTVVAVDDDRKLILVGLKQRTPSPWSTNEVPGAGTRIQVEIVEDTGAQIIVKLRDGPADSPALADRQDSDNDLPPGPSSTVIGALYGRILSTEWSWYPPNDPTYVAPTLGSTIEVEVVVPEQHRDDLLLSRRNLEVIDWEAAQRKYVKGTPVRVRVLTVNREEGFLCELEPGVFGRIPAHKITQYGLELADFQNTVVPGTRYDAVVVGSKHRRKDFRLELARPV